MKLILDTHAFLWLVDGITEEQGTTEHSRVRRGGLAAPSSSSNRTCRFPAYGFRSDFCQRCNQRSCGRS
jgi:hypothetical protein